MAAARLVVSTEEMMIAKDKYTSCKDTQMQAYKQMKSAVDELMSVWKGPASIAFSGVFTLLYNNIAKSEIHMQDAIDELKNISTTFDAIEEQQQNAFKGLDTGRDL